MKCGGACVWVRVCACVWVCNGACVCVCVYVGVCVRVKTHLPTMTSQSNIGSGLRFFVYLSYLSSYSIDAGHYG